MNTLLKKHIDYIRKLCTRFNVEQLYVFGSVTSDNFGSNSDVDLLVQFQEDIPLLEFANNYFEFHKQLEDLLERKVDLVTEKSVHNPYLVRSIDNTKKKIYDRKGQKVSF